MDGMCSSSVFCGSVTLAPRVSVSSVINGKGYGTPRSHSLKVKISYDDIHKCMVITCLGLGRTCTTYGLRARRALLDQHGRQGCSAGNLRRGTALRPSRSCPGCKAGCASCGSSWQHLAVCGFGPHRIAMERKTMGSEPERTKEQRGNGAGEKRRSSCVEDFSLC